MKNTIKVLGIAVLVTAIGFAMIGCSNPSSGDTGGGGGSNRDTSPETVTYLGEYNGTTYALIITQSGSTNARYTAKQGDTYVLTTGEKTSTGTVQSFNNNTFSLKPSNSQTPFEATVSDEGLTGFNNTENVKWTDGTPATLPTFQLTPIGVNSSGNSYLGQRLVIYGVQVYTEDDINPNSTTISYTPYKGKDLLLAWNLWEKCEITNGKLYCNIGTPSDLHPFELNQMHSLYSPFYNYEEVKANDTSVLCDDLSLSYGDYYWDGDQQSGESAWYELSRNNMTIITSSSTSFKYTREQVHYLYVDRDVTIIGTGKSRTGSDLGFPATVTSKNFSLALKAGWNAVCEKRTTTMTGNINQQTISSAAEDIDLTLGNPSSFKWVLDIQRSSNNGELGWD